MNTTLNRFRRWVVAAIAATTLLSTGIIFAEATPAAAAGAEVGSITASSAPTVFHGVLDQVAGDETVALGPKDTIENGDTLDVYVQDNGGNNGVISWDGVPTITVNNVVGDIPPCIEGQACDPSGTAPFIVGGPGGDELEITFYGNSSGTTIFGATDQPDQQTIALTNIHYNVGPHGVAPSLGTPDDGPVDVSAYYEGSSSFELTPGVPPGSSGNASTNAVVSSAVSAPTAALKAVTTPVIPFGGQNEPAGSWNLSLLSSGPGSVISAGDAVHIVLADDAGFNCRPGTLAEPDSIGFATIPSLDITAGAGGATGVPTATASISSTNDGPDVHCAGSGVNNELTITFTNASPIVITSTTLVDIEIQITGVKYNVSGDAVIIGDSTPDGDIAVASNYDINGVTTLPGAFSTTPAGPTVASSGPSNADLAAISVLGNTPPADVQLNVTSLTGSGSEAVDQPISPITLSEAFPGAVPSGVNGFVCVSLLEGAEWDSSTTAPTAAATGGMAVSAPIVLTTGPLAGDSTLVFQVTTGSSTGPATITLANLDVSVPQSLEQDILGGFVVVTYGGTDASCDHGITTSTATKAFSVSGRIYGTDADATAAQAFEIANPVGAGGNETAVLATDTDPYDALSSSYLAGQSDTGVLLTPTAAISSETLSALRIEGVETVYVTGGPDAISGAAISQLESTPSYYPGGLTERYDAFTNDSQLLTVQQIFGATADGTASQIAQFVGAHPIGNPAFQAGYGGQYNDTSGSSGSSVSSAPDLGVNTAIIATDTGFQDAASASVMAYHNNLPLILSPAAALSTDAIAALQNDGIQQVIVMGGPDVINDSVLTQLEGMGISVLRVAGSDYTDTSAEAAALELNNTNAAGQFDGFGYSTIGALGAPAGLNLNVQSLSFARGDFYSDALVSSQINSLLESPELLTENPTTLGTPVTTFLATEGNPATAFGGTHPLGSGVSVFHYTVVGGQAIFGGPDAIASATETAIATAIGPDQLPIP